MSMLDEILDSLIYDYLKSKNYISAQVLAKEAEIKPLSSTAPKLIDFMKTYFSAYEVVKSLTNDKRPLLDSEYNLDPGAKRVKAGDLPNNPVANKAIVNPQVTSPVQVASPGPRATRNLVTSESNVDPKRSSVVREVIDLDQAEKPANEAPDDNSSNSESSESESPSEEDKPSSVSSAKTKVKRTATPGQTKTNNLDSERRVTRQSAAKSRPKKIISSSKSSSDEDSTPSSSPKKKVDGNATKSSRVPIAVQRVITNLARSRPLSNNTNQRSAKDNTPSSDSDSSSDEEEPTLTVTMKMNPIPIKMEANKAPSSVQKDGNNSPRVRTASSSVNPSSNKDSSSSEADSSSESDSSSDSDSSQSKKDTQSANKKSNVNKTSTEQSVSKNSPASKSNSASSKDNLNSSSPRSRVSSPKANKLLEALKAKGKFEIEKTKDMIRRKLAPRPDLDVVTTKLKVSLLCPLSKKRMEIPCRATTCSHIQCFDAEYYLQMNEKKPTWICPVGNERALPEHLVIDGLFANILSRVPDLCTEVLFHDNARWTPILPKKVLAPRVGVNDTGRK